MSKQWGRPLVGVGLVIVAALVFWPVFGATSALAALKAGKSPDPALTTSYGCDVKY